MADFHNRRGNNWNTRGRGHFNRGGNRNFNQGGNAFRRNDRDEWQEHNQIGDRNFDASPSRNDGQYWDEYDDRDSRRMEEDFYREAELQQDNEREFDDRHRFNDGDHPNKRRRTRWNRSDEDKLKYGDSPEPDIHHREFKYRDDDIPYDQADYREMSPGREFPPIDDIHDMPSDRRHRIHRDRNSPVMDRDYDNGRRLERNDQFIEEEHYDNRLDDFDNRRGGHDNRLDDFDNRRDGHDNRHDGFDNRRDGHDNRHDDFDSRQDGWRYNDDIEQSQDRSDWRPDQDIQDAENNFDDFGGRDQRDYSQERDHSSQPRDQNFNDHPRNDQNRWNNDSRRGRRDRGHRHNQTWHRDNRSPEPDQLDVLPNERQDIDEGNMVEAALPEMVQLPEDPVLVNAEGQVIGPASFPIMIQPGVEPQMINIIQDQIGHTMVPGPIGLMPDQVLMQQGSLPQNDPPNRFRGRGRAFDRGRGRGRGRGFHHGNDKGCFSCGQEGHLARDCPNKNSPACFTCGQNGHMARDCPNVDNIPGGMVMQSDIMGGDNMMMTPDMPHQPMQTPVFIPEGNPDMDMMNQGPPVEPVFPTDEEDRYRNDNIRHQREFDDRHFDAQDKQQDRRRRSPSPRHSRYSDRQDRSSDRKHEKSSKRKESDDKPFAKIASRLEDVISKDSYRDKKDRQSDMITILQSALDVMQSKIRSKDKDQSSSSSSTRSNKPKSTSSSSRRSQERFSTRSDGKVSTERHDDSSHSGSSRNKTDHKSQENKPREKPHHSKQEEKRGTKDTKTSDLIKQEKTRSEKGGKVETKSTQNTQELIKELSQKLEGILTAQRKDNEEDKTMIMLLRSALDVARKRAQDEGKTEKHPRTKSSEKPRSEEKKTQERKHKDTLSPAENKATNEKSKAIKTTKKTLKKKVSKKEEPSESEEEDVESETGEDEEVEDEEEEEEEESSAEEVVSKKKKSATKIIKRKKLPKKENIRKRSGVATEEDVDNEQAILPLSEEKKAKRAAQIKKENQQKEGALKQSSESSQPGSVQQDKEGQNVYTSRAISTTTSATTRTVFNTSSVAAPFVQTGPGVVPASFTSAPPPGYQPQTQMYIPQSMSQPTRHPVPQQPAASYSISQPPPASYPVAQPPPASYSVPQPVTISQTMTQQLTGPNMSQPLPVGTTQWQISGVSSQSVLPRQPLTNPPRYLTGQPVSSSLPQQSYAAGYNANLSYPVSQSAVPHVVSQSAVPHVVSQSTVPSSIVPTPTSIYTSNMQVPAPTMAPPQRPAQQLQPDTMPQSIGSQLAPVANAAAQLMLQRMRGPFSRPPGPVMPPIQRYATPTGAPIWRPGGNQISSASKPLFPAGSAVSSQVQSSGPVITGGPVKYTTPTTAIQNNTSQQNLQSKVLTGQEKDTKASVSQQNQTKNQTKDDGNQQTKQALGTGQQKKNFGRNKKQPAQKLSFPVRATETKPGGLFGRNTVDVKEIPQTSELNRENPLAVAERQNKLKKEQKQTKNDRKTNQEKNIAGLIEEISKSKVINEKNAMSKSGPSGDLFQVGSVKSQSSVSQTNQSKNVYNTIDAYVDKSVTRAQKEKDDRRTRWSDKDDKSSVKSRSMSPKEKPKIDYKSVIPTYGRFRPPPSSPDNRKGDKRDSRDRSHSKSSRSDRRSKSPNSSVDRKSPNLLASSASSRVSPDRDITYNSRGSSSQYRELDRKRSRRSPENFDRGLTDFSRDSYHANRTMDKFRDRSPGGLRDISPEPLLDNSPRHDSLSRHYRGISPESFRSLSPALRDISPGPFNDLHPPLEHDTYRRSMSPAYSRDRYSRHSRGVSPLRSREKSPIYSRERSPLYSRERSPLRSRERSPLHSRERSSLYSRDRSPLHSRERSHLHSKERSPLHSRERSPLHSRERSSYSGDRTLHSREKSPLHIRERSPLQSGERSPMYSQRGRSPNYSRITRSPVYMDRSPTHLRDQSPRRVRDLANTSRSPYIAQHRDQERSASQYHNDGKIQTSGRLSPASQEAVNRALAAKKAQNETDPGVKQPKSILKKTDTDPSKRFTSGALSSIQESYKEPSGALPEHFVKKLTEWLPSLTNLVQNKPLNTPTTSVATTYGQHDYLTEASNTVGNLNTKAQAVSKTGMEDSYESFLDVIGFERKGEKPAETGKDGPQYSYNTRKEENQKDYIPGLDLSYTNKDMGGTSDIGGSQQSSASYGNTMDSARGSPLPYSRPGSLLGSQGNLQSGGSIGQNNQFVGGVQSETVANRTIQSNFSMGGPSGLINQPPIPPGNFQMRGGPGGQMNQSTNFQQGQQHSGQMTQHGNQENFQSSGLNNQINQASIPGSFVYGAPPVQTNQGNLPFQQNQPNISGQNVPANDPHSMDRSRFPSFGLGLTQGIGQQKMGTNIPGIIGSQDVSGPSFLSSNRQISYNRPGVFPSAARINQILRK